MFSAKFFIYLYTILITTVLLLSGIGQDRGLHDSFIMRSDGPIFLCKDVDLTLKFYRQVLDLTEGSLHHTEKASSDKKSSNQNLLRSISLPDKSNLHLSENSNLVSGPSSYMLTVRNNFKKLHAELLQRERQLSANSESQRFVSQIQKNSFGKFFTLTDIDNNQLFFVKSKAKK